MKITEETIPHIEKALGLKLYKHQLEYLLEGTSVPPVRCSGKTLAYCIKLSLSDGKPLDIRRPHMFVDYNYDYLYTKSFFVKHFLDIWSKLKEYGFPVREIIFPNGKG